MNLADNPQNPPTPKGDNLWRAQHFNLCMGMIEKPAVAVMREANPGITLIDYIRPTRWVNWTRTIVDGEWGEPNALVPLTPEYRAACAAGVKQRLDETGLDGIQIDCPFEVHPMNKPMDGVRLVAEIAQAIAPRFVIPNFGDGLTWSLQNKDLREAAGSLGHLCEWQFVQVAVDVGHVVRLVRWEALRPFVIGRLNAGKKLVLGVYDSGGAFSADAAAFMLSYQHPNLYWLYCTDANPAPRIPVQDFQWNEFLARLVGM